MTSNRHDPRQSEPGSDVPAFSYETFADDSVVIAHRGRRAVVLRGRSAARFVVRIERCDEPGAQRLMARETGQYRFGNERQARDTHRR